MRSSGVVRQTLFAVVLAATFAIVAVTPLAQAGEEISNPLGESPGEKCEFLITVKRYDDAIEACRSATAVHVPTESAYYNLGLAYYYSAKYPDARRQFENAIAVNHQSARAYHRLGETLMAQNLPDEAVSAFKKSIAVDPNYRYAYYALGSAYMSSYGNEEDYDRAIELFDKAQRLSNDGGLSEAPAFEVPSLELTLPGSRSPQLHP